MVTRMNVNTLRTLLAGVVGAAIVAGCAGDGGSLPNATTNGATTTMMQAARSKHKVKATIRIAIPKRKARRRKLRPDYISPATQSIAIVVTPNSGGAPTNYYIDLTPATNPNCTASLVSPLICTVSLSLAPGKYVASFTTYDGLTQGTNGPPSGNALSANQNVPVTIAAGSANSIDVVLDGVPTSVAFVPSVASGIGGSMSAGFAAPKCGLSASAVSVIGIDADGNYILGPGAPTPALTVPASSPVTVATPSPGSPNLFKLTTATIPPSPVTLTASVTPAAQSGGVAQTAQISLSFNGNCTIAGNVTLYSDAGDEPGGIVTGPDGALWFTGNAIGRITTTGTITHYSIPTANSIPDGITAGSDGALWFTECLGNKIGRITTSGAVTEYSIPTSASSPNTIATGADGALWFTECRGNKIGRITTTGTMTEYTVPTGASSLYDITRGPDNALWFTEFFGNKIGRITTSGTITEYSIPPTQGGNTTGPWGITSGPDGALWFTECLANKIGRITTNGTITEYSGLAAPNNAGEPTAITAGPDGALWFVSNYVGDVGRITTSGTLSEYSYQYSAQGATGITVGPDYGVWFTNWDAGNIGVVR
jgi:virginiamycin B lyase